MLGILLTPVWPSVSEELQGQKEIRRKDQLLIGDQGFPLNLAAGLKREQESAFIYFVTPSQTHHILKPKIRRDIFPRGKHNLCSLQYMA